ncbi:MAG: hypothetical protein HYY06_29205 [Deltaproteobacteria bacterium]|nr:hypothetical protein [Deltaproteobacteria bacterium]
MEAVWRAHEDDGLQALATIWEDPEHGPVDAADALDWQEAYDLTHPVLIERERYFETDTRPASWIVDLSSMQILSVTMGRDTEVEERVCSFLGC